MAVDQGLLLPIGGELAGMDGAAAAHLRK
jgi:hypothetical protein